MTFPYPRLPFPARHFRLGARSSPRRPGHGILTQRLVTLRPPSGRDRRGRTGRHHPVRPLTPWLPISCGLKGLPTEHPSVKWQELSVMIQEPPRKGSCGFPEPSRSHKNEHAQSLENPPDSSSSQTTVGLVDIIIIPSDHPRGWEAHEVKVTRDRANRAHAITAKHEAGHDCRS